MMELSSVLVQCKDESIEGNFKGVSRLLWEVFSLLIQGSNGYLVLKKKEDGNDSVVNSDDDSPLQSIFEGRVEKCMRVKPKVSFMGHLKQFSRGKR